MEKARLTQMLAKMKEDEGNIDEAASLMQEVQAPRKALESGLIFARWNPLGPWSAGRRLLLDLDRTPYRLIDSIIDATEEYILNQMRLVLAKKDFARAPTSLGMALP